MSSKVCRLLLLFALLDAGLASRVIAGAATVSPTVASVHTAAHAATRRYARSAPGRIAGLDFLGDGWPLRSSSASRPPRPQPGVPLAIDQIERDLPVEGAQALAVPGPPDAPRPGAVQCAHVPAHQGHVVPARMPERGRMPACVPVVGGPDAAGRGTTADPRGAGRRRCLLWLDLHLSRCLHGGSHPTSSLRRPSRRALLHRRASCETEYNLHR